MYVSSQTRAVSGLVTDSRLIPSRHPVSVLRRVTAVCASCVDWSVSPGPARQSEQRRSSLSLDTTAVPSSLSLFTTSFCLQLSELWRSLFYIYCVSRCLRYKCIKRSAGTTEISTLPYYQDCECQALQVVTLFNSPPCWWVCGERPS